LPQAGASSADLLGNGLDLLVGGCEGAVQCAERVLEPDDQAGCGLFDVLGGDLDLPDRRAVDLDQDPGAVLPGFDLGAERVAAEVSEGVRLGAVPVDRVGQQLRQPVADCSGCVGPFVVAAVTDLHPERVASG
jgi:hypothetical protein